MDNQTSQNNIAPSKVFLYGNMRFRFEALQHTLVPRSQRFSEIEKKRSLDLINTLLSQQTTSSRIKLALFITLIDILSVCCHARLFRKLPANKQTRVLQFFFNSTFALFRKGFWGLNTLARLGVYGQKELHEEIGYHLRVDPDTAEAKQ